MILNGYGGFAIAETPVWSPQIAAWCAAGGVYAIAGLRGGIEEGDAWHHAGRRGAKQNVFDDFHAGADWLVDDRAGRRDRDSPCSVARTAGLLVGVALTQRPDLCRAVWCGVPLLDMVRFPQFSIARLWTSEYGDPDVAEEFAWLHAYSPYHHVVDGTCYPATLFQTAEGDSRVDPLHARKMAALVQAASPCQDDRPDPAVPGGRAPATGSASRSPSGPTSSPTACRSSPGSSRWRGRRDGARRVARRRRPARAVGAARPDRRRRHACRSSAPASASIRRPNRASWAGCSRALADPSVTDIDGLATEVVAPAPPVLVEHPNGAIGLDHVVVDDERPRSHVCRVEAATGAPLRRVREVGEIRQGFHRLGGGGLIVEVVERAGLARRAGVVLGARHQRRGPRRRRRRASAPTASVTCPMPCSPAAGSPRCAASSVSACRWP